MPGPHWLPYIFAGVMVAVSTYCSLRLLTARRLRRRIHVDVNIAHVSMGISMAGMLVPALRTFSIGLWESAFAGLAAWFAWKSVRFIAVHAWRGAAHDLRYVTHYLTHLVMSCAMIYMYMAAPAGSEAGSGAVSMGGVSGSTANFVGLPLFFVVVLCVSAIWHIDRLSSLSQQVSVLVSAGAPEGDLGAIGDHADPGEVASLPPVPGTTDTGFMAPRAEMVCHIAMCITMGYMLVLVL